MALLKKGHPIRFETKGGSMSPAIVDGEIIKVEPIAVSEIRPGDIILYEAGNRIIAHRVIRTIKGKRSRRPGSPLGPESIRPKASSKGPTLQDECTLSFMVRGDAFKICDRPVSSHRVLGKVVSVTRRGEEIQLSANFTPAASH